MSFETVNQDILIAYHAAVAQIHARLANTLAQAGHPVSEENTASELINSAAAVAQTIGKPAAANVAPNYADFALGAFMDAMTQAAITFAAAHLPAEYKPVEEALSADVQAALGGAPVTAAAVVEDVTEAAGAAASIAEPELAPVVALAEPVVERAEASLLDGSAAPAAVAVPEAVTVTDKAALLDDTH